ncbi:hypothetical protein HPB51_012436 [Rhipicephalus microplus]|uniref:SLC26A/SulP transporter domain-containing protein n=1 Tax=Rhipicephalus microplus TaxID=6941 RepID=A0A9J6EA37_RHIMP|nr:hypothetical protein HPB51_012436 [Rhipicephalus microplus]
MTARSSAGYPAARGRHGFTQDGFDTEFAQQRPTTKGPLVSRLRHALGRKWKRRGAKSRLLGCFPIASWIREYDVRHDLLPDVLTGITLAIFHVPQSFGYSLLAEVSPIYGLYTSLFPMLMYAVFGSSRHASIGAFAVVSIMTGNLVEENKREYTAAEVATTLSFLLLFGMLRLGSLSVFLSEQLVSGFTAGVSVHIGSSQLPGLFGINVPVYSGPFHLIKGYIEFFRRIAETHLPTLALSITSFIIMLLIKILADPFLLKKIGIPFPIEMVVVIFGTLLSHHINLEGYNMSVIEHIEHQMPRPHSPVFSAQLLSSLAAPALAVSVVSYAITISLGRIFARKHKYAIDPNQEFIALGACNVFGAFFACFPVGASVPRSSIQEGAGGKTQGATPHQPSPPLRPAQSEPSAVAPAPKAAVAQATAPTPKQRPETPESSGLKASPHQARPKIQTNSPHVRASSASEEAMDTSAPLVPKQRRGSLERAKKTKKQITGPGDGPVK